MGVSKRGAGGWNGVMQMYFGQGAGGLKGYENSWTVYQLLKGRCSYLFGGSLHEVGSLFAWGAVASGESVEQLGDP